MKSIHRIIAAAFVLCSPAAWTHHSFAMFDRTKTITVAGTVKEFQYTNPHSWLQVYVPNEKGEAVEWSFEMEGPSTLLRAGIKKSTLQPGEKITVSAWGMKDGRPAGAVVSITKADGTLIKPRPAPPSP